MKHCPICRLDKQLEDFPKRTKTRSTGSTYTYYEAQCKSCKEHAKYLRRKANPAAYERMKARARVRIKRKYDQDPNPTFLRTRKWIQKQIEDGGFKERWLKYKYGLTLGDYNQKRAEQHYCCAICKTSEEELGYLLNVDHCHDHGTVRGLLCVKCNTAIGKLNHDPALLTKAINYLQPWYDTCNRI